MTLDEKSGQLSPSKPITVWLGWNHRDQCWSSFDGTQTNATPTHNYRESFVGQVLSTMYTTTNDSVGCPFSRKLHLYGVAPLYIPPPCVRTRAQFEELSLLSRVIFEKGGRVWLTDIRDR